jgi:hypothetical protein
LAAGRFPGLRDDDISQTISNDLMTYRERNQAAEAARFSLFKSQNAG